MTVMAFLHRLFTRIAGRDDSACIERLDARALRDLGLSRSDLPAIRTGLIGRDASRRPRGTEERP